MNIKDYKFAAVALALGFILSAAEGSAVAQQNDDQRKPGIPTTQTVPPVNDPFSDAARAEDANQSARDYQYQGKIQPSQDNSQSVTGISNPPPDNPSGSSPQTLPTPAPPNSCSNSPLPRCDSHTIVPTAISAGNDVDLPEAPRAQTPVKPPPQLKEARLQRSKIRIDYEEASMNTAIIGSLSFVHSNAAPGTCDCFFLPGFSGGLDWAISKQLGAIGRVEYNWGHAAGGENLGVLFLEGGAKYNFHNDSVNRFSYFVEGRGGFAKPHSNYIANNDWTYAISAGGGADYSINSRCSWRIVEAVGTLTGEGNGYGNKQENLRLTTGIKFKFNRWSR